METVVLLNGCFWGTERMLSGFPGVETTAGYSGGTSVEPPTYYDLDRSGHSEAVRVRYDPDLVSLAEILGAAEEKSATDPSPRTNPRYRRAVLCTTPAQAAAAIGHRESTGASFAVATGFVFHPAEPYHLKYYDRVLGPA